MIELLNELLPASGLKRIVRPGVSLQRRLVDGWERLVRGDQRQKSADRLLVADGERVVEHASGDEIKDGFDVGKVDGG